MAGLRYVRMLKDANPESEVWWDGSPSCYGVFKSTMLERYHELRTVIDSLMPEPLAANFSGITGVTTNPRLINTAFLHTHQYPDRRTINSRTNWLDAAQHRRTIYSQLVLDAARQLVAMWHASSKRFGWLSAQVDPFLGEDTSAIVKHGLELSRLAPNIMIKIPGSQAGYLAIEQLVAQGCSINNTFCFTVSQFAAGLAAVERGRAKARRLGVDVAQARYVISFMIGRFGADEAFDRQARALGIGLSTEDKRWAELAVYDAIQTLLTATPSPVRLLIASIKVDGEGQEGEHCWHLERTGERTTLYTLPAPIIEFLLRRERAGRPVLPAARLAIPVQVLDKLLRIDYFKQAYQLGGLEPERFAQHPAFVTALQYACGARAELDGFIESLGMDLPQRPVNALRACAGGRT